MQANKLKGRNSLSGLVPYFYLYLDPYFIQLAILTWVTCGYIQLCLFFVMCKPCLYFMSILFEPLLTVSYIECMNVKFAILR